MSSGRDMVAFGVGRVSRSRRTVPVLVLTFGINFRPLEKKVG
jgi:hypothetical protein